MTRSRSPGGESSSNAKKTPRGRMSRKAVEADDHEDVHHELERLRDKYETLLKKHKELRQETSELKDVAILPHVWTPYIKFMFLWAVTALILFALGRLFGLSQNGSTGLERFTGLFCLLVWLATARC